MEGWVTVNVDGAYSHRNGKAGCGGIIKDHTDNLIEAFMLNIQDGDPLSIELWACLIGLKRAWDRNHRRVYLKSGSLDALKLIREGNNDLHENWNIIIESHHMLKRDWSIDLRHVKRENNFEADILAKHALEMPFGFHLLPLDDGVIEPNMEAKPRDLLSDLPDVLLHYVVSFLGVKDILKLKSLSRRLNNTLSITTIPSLCFFDDDSCSCTHVFEFTMNTIPHNRPHVNSIINRISFSSSCDKDEHCELHEQWIIKSFESFHVDELYLDYELPSIFINLPKFQSLKVLRLNMYNRGPTLVKVLPKMKLASLETLHMKSIYFKYSLDDWISQSFPSLKHLSLEEIMSWKTQNAEFTIRSSNLEDLKVHNFKCAKPVKIFTENLHTLNCYFGVKYFERYKTNFMLETCDEPHLQNLTWVGCPYPLSLLYDEEMFQDLQVINFPRSLIMQESNSNVLFQLFKAIRFVRELHVDTQVLQYLMRMFKDSHGEAPISLRNLRHLEIHIRFDHIQDEDYITFLKRLSNLETLTLVNYGSGMSSYVKERPVRDQFKTALRYIRRKHRVRRTTGLKKVKLITEVFDYSIVILIGLLIKSCSNLEEMMFYYPSCYHKSMMKEGVKYLQYFERASPRPPLFRFYFLKN